MLVDIAIGDAYGISFEFADHEDVKLRNIYPPAGYVYRPNGYLDPGHYTDDTQMSLAIVEHILEDRAWTPDSLIRSFLQAFKRDPRQGYSKGFYQVLNSVHTVEEFKKVVSGDSKGCGSAMRSIPIGLANSPEVAMEMAEIQARITHNSDEGVKSSQAIALASYFALNHIGDKEEIYAFINRYIPDIDLTYDGSYVPNRGYPVAASSLYAYVNNTLYSDILWNSVNFTGDVDSVAAIALGLASLDNQHVNDLDRRFYNHLENKKYGLNYLEEIDRKVADFSR